MRPTRGADDEPSTLTPTDLVTPFLFLGLALVGPLVAISSYVTTSPQAMGTTTWLLVAVMAMAGARLSWLIHRGQRRLLETSVWVFSYVFMGAAPIVQLRSGIEPDTTPGLDPNQLTPAAVVVVVGLVAFAVGLVSRRRQAEDVVVAAVRPLKMWRVFAASLAALLLTAYYVNKVGASSFALGREAFDTHRIGILGEDNAPLIVAVCTFPLVVSLIAARVLSGQRRAAGKPRLFIVPLVLAATALAVVNPISSARYPAGTVVLAVLASYGAYSTATRYRVTTLAFLLGLIYLFPVADLYRRAGTGAGATEEVSPNRAMLSGDFDSFAQISNTLVYIHDQGITWGHQALALPLFWVPRSFWENKPLDTGTVVAEHRGYDFTNLSAPIWAELMINGGVPLLLLGMFLIGRFVRRFDDRAVVLTERGEAMPVLNYILPFYALILMRGSLLQATLILAVIVGWSVLIGGTSLRPWRARRQRVAASIPEDLRTSTSLR